MLGIGCLAVILGIVGGLNGKKATAVETPAKPLRHIVLFQFKETSTPKDVDAIVAKFESLPGRIPEIIGFECGTDVGVENLSQGFTHGFVVTFENEKGREIYLPHPAHQEFVDLVKPHVKQVLVFDFFVK